MKKLLLIVVICLGVFQYFSKNSVSDEPIANTVTIVPVKIAVPKKTAMKYTCDGREYCSQMGSYEEAKFFLQHCPDTKMDGDRDGIPCERQFGR